MRRAPERADITDALIRLIEARGYRVENPDALRTPTLSISIQGPPGSRAHPLNEFIQLLADEEDPRRMPSMYAELSAFIDQVPEIQRLQLKPLLFAFFVHTVVMMQTADARQEAEAFYRSIIDSGGVKPFHSFHDSDLKKLNASLTDSAIRPQGQALAKVSFAISLTETTYHALVAFLMDRWFMRFLRILDNNIKVHFVPLDHFSSRPDRIAGFICHSSDQAEATLAPVTMLLADNPYDLAKRHLDREGVYRFFDDDAVRASPGFSLPPILHDRVLAIASDIRNMVPLSKTSLPSCAYFTFQQENISYDINGSGTLIAAATERGYVKLFSTSAWIDLDDDVKFQQIRSQSNHLLVPRQLVGPANDQHYCTRTLIGPRSYVVRFSPECRLLLSGSVGTIRLWSCETAAGAFSEFQTFPNSIVWCADWSPWSYHFATGSSDSYVFVWCLDRATPLRFFPGHQDAITDLKFHPNPATIATCSYDRSTMLWDVRASEPSGQAMANPCTRMFADSVEVPRVLQFTRNGRVLIVGDDAGKISPWDIGEGRKIGSVKAHHGAVRDLTVSVEGAILASAGSHADVALWDMGTLCSTSASGAEALKRFQPRKADTHRVAFSSRNLLHAIGTTKTPQE